MGVWYYYCCLDCKKFEHFGKYVGWQAQRNWIRMNLKKNKGGEYYETKEIDGVKYIAAVDWFWFQEDHAAKFLGKHWRHRIVIVSEFDPPFNDELPEDEKYGAKSLGWSKEEYEEEDVFYERDMAVVDHLNRWLKREERMEKDGTT